MALLQEISQRSQLELEQQRRNGIYYRRFSEQCVMTPESAVFLEENAAPWSAARRPSVCPGPGRQGAGLVSSIVSSCDVEPRPWATNAASCDMDAQTLYAFFVGQLLQARVWRDAGLGVA